MSAHSVKNLRELLNIIRDTAQQVGATVEGVQPPPKGSHYKVTLGYRGQRRKQIVAASSHWNKSEWCKRDTRKVLREMGAPI